MPKRYDATQMTIQFSMIVVITSWAPTVPFRKPAIPATSAPASIPPTIETTISRRRGRSTRSGISVAMRMAAVDPAMYWPCPPMLKRPQRNANATARPVSTSGVQRISVCWRFVAASDSMSSVFHGNHTRASENGRPMSWLPTSKNQERPEPRKMARYVSSVSPRFLVVR